jgi:Fe-Mn family superoxide dismutase
VASAALAPSTEAAWCLSWCSSNLLAIDAWEHAFYLQYENRKADYVEAICNVVNWADVAARLGRARLATP